MYCLQVPCFNVKFNICALVEVARRYEPNAGPSNAHSQRTRLGHDFSVPLFFIAVHDSDIQAILHQPSSISCQANSLPTPGA